MNLCLAVVGRKVRPTHQVVNLLQVGFSGDMLAKLEAYERDLALYDQASISDGLRVGSVLNRVTDTELATHLLLNSERFQTWALFRRELLDVSRARAAASEHRWRSTHCSSTVTRSVTRAEDSVTSRRIAGKTKAKARERIPRAKVARRVRAKAR